MLERRREELGAAAGEERGVEVAAAAISCMNVDSLTMGVDGAVAVDLLFARGVVKSTLVGSLVFITSSVLAASSSIAAFLFFDSADEGVPTVVASFGAREAAAAAAAAAERDERVGVGVSKEAEEGEGSAAVGRLDAAEEDRAARVRRGVVRVASTGASLFFSFSAFASASSVDAAASLPLRLPGSFVN